MISTNVTTISAALIAAVLATGGAERYLPVVYGMEAVDLAKTGDQVTGRIIGNKLLDCPIVENSFAAWHLKGGLWSEDGQIQFLDDLTPNSSRPTGKQNFGIWQWSGVPEEATAVRVTLLHNCDGRIRVTTAGPFELNE